METQSKLIVLGLVSNPEGEFLISQRFDPDFPEAHLKWDLLGGSNESGESLEETVRREIKEESGLDVIVKDLIPETVSMTWERKGGGKGHVTVKCYNCSLIGGEMHLNDHKIQDLKWIKKEDFAKYDFLPTVKNFIELI